MTLSGSFNHSVPQSPHLQGKGNGFCFPGFWRTSHGPVWKSIWSRGDTQWVPVYMTAGNSHVRKWMPSVLPGVLRTHRSPSFATKEKTKHLKVWRLSRVRTNKNPISSHRVVFFAWQILKTHQDGPVQGWVSRVWSWKCVHLAVVPEQGKPIDALY